MYAVAWTDLAIGGAFLVGIGVGVIITMRVARVVANYLTDLRKKEDP